MTATEQPSQPNYDAFTQQPHYGPAQPPYGGFPGQPQYAVPMPPQQPAPKKRRRWPWVVGGVFAFLVLVSAIGGNGASNTTMVTPAATSADGSSVPSAVSTGSPATASAGSHVVYEVTGGKKSGVVTYSVGQAGSIAQQQSAPLPWRKEFDVNGGFFVPTVSAQNAGSGSITCRITVDGEVVAEVTSQGQYTIASCVGKAIM